MKAHYNALQFSTYISLYAGLTTEATQDERTPDPTVSVAEPTQDNKWLKRRQV